MSELFIKPFQDNLSENIFTPRHTKKNSQQGTLLIIEKKPINSWGYISFLLSSGQCNNTSAYTGLTSAFHPDFKSLIVYVSINLESLH